MFMAQHVILSNWVKPFVMGNVSYQIRYERIVSEKESCTELLEVYLKKNRQIKQCYLNSFKSFFLFRVRDFICELQFAF